MTMNAAASRDKRLLEFDIIRAIAILMIVLYHMYLYISSDLFGIHYLWSISQGYLVLLGLGLFFFVSGFVIHHRYPILASKDEIKTFLTRRAIRIYPLYEIALFVTLAGALFRVIPTRLSDISFTPLGIFIYALGAQGLFAPLLLPYVSWAYWFIGIILLYYLLYPLLIRYSSNNVQKLVLISVAVFLTFFAARETFNTIDYRFFLYYFIFIGGIVSSILIDKLAVIKKNRPFVMMASALSLAALMYAYSYLLNSADFSDIPSAFTVTEPSIFVFNLVLFILRDVMIFIFVLFIYCAAGYIIRLSELLRAFQIVSYSSYSLYLFHVPILAALATALTRVINTGLLEKDVLFIIIGLPATCLISFAIQRIADVGLGQLVAVRKDN